MIVVCVGGRYQLLGELGHGGMSTVFLAVDTVLHKQWAVKETVLQGNEEYQKGLVQSLRTEVDVLKECDHPAIPRIVDFFEENGRAYAVRDYVKGCSLKTLVREHGLQDATVIRDWGMQLCAILSYLHAHYPPIIYGDLKPSHVMIADDGSVRLIDFGAATQWYTHTGVLDLRSIEQNDVQFATPRFTAPEVLNNNVVTPASDVYSVGMTLLYALLPSETSHVGLHVASPYRNHCAMLDQLVSVLATATATQSTQRYQDCEAMFAALEACDDNEEHRSRNNDVDAKRIKRKHHKERIQHYRHMKCDASKQRKDCSHPRQRNKRRLLQNKHGITLGVLAAVIVLTAILFNCLGVLSSNAAMKQTQQASTSISQRKRMNVIRRNKADYDSYVRLAERESKTDVAGRYVAHAMQIQNNMVKKRYVRKMSLRPLQVLLRVQLADQQWSTVEEHKLMSLISVYEQQLHETTQAWAQFAGDIAKAYWYYFAGFSGKVMPTERLARMRVAQVWFREAQKYEKEKHKKDDLSSSVASASERILHDTSHKSVLNIYIALADCYMRIVDVVQDAPNATTYQQYVRQLQQLVQIAQRNQKDVLCVDTGELVLQSLHSWLHMFYESGVNKQELQQLCDDAYDLLKQARVVNDESEKRQRIALNNVPQVREEIAAVFAENNNTR